MHVRITTACLVLAALLGWISSAQAQGKGKANGLSRAMSSAGGHGKASGLNRASQNLSRAGASMGRANGLQRTPSLGRAPVGKGPLAAAPNLVVDPRADQPSAAAAHQQQLLIEQRNRDHRLAQAQHLRDIAAKNGDIELATNADRMAAFANEHYAERVEHLQRFGVTDPNLPPSDGPVASTPPDDTVAAPTDSTRTAGGLRPRWWPFGR